MDLLVTLSSSLAILELFEITLYLHYFSRNSAMPISVYTVQTSKLRFNIIS